MPTLLFFNRAGALCEALRNTQLRPGQPNSFSEHQPRFLRPPPFEIALRKQEITPVAMTPTVLHLRPTRRTCYNLTHKKICGRKECPFIHKMPSPPQLKTPLPLTWTMKPNAHPGEDIMQAILNNQEEKSWSFQTFTGPVCLPPTLGTGFLPPVLPAKAKKLRSPLKTKKLTCPPRAKIRILVRPRAEKPSAVTPQQEENQLKVLQEKVRIAEKEDFELMNSLRSLLPGAAEKLGDAAVLDILRDAGLDPNQL